MRIRSFTQHDLPHVLELNNASVPDVNELGADEVARLTDLADEALVADVDGTFAGFCWTIGPGKDYASLNYRWFDDHYSAFAYLDRIAVHPDFRRFGIGRAFYDELLRLFTGRVPVICCEVNLRPRNEPSLRFHHSVGFREVGQQDTDGGSKTVSLMALELPTSR